MMDKLKEELRCCLVIYFSSVKSQDWMEHFCEVVLKCAAGLGRVLTHFEFWPKDTKTHASMLQYSKRNQSRLMEAFKSDEFRGISIYSKDKGIFWSPLYFSLVTKEPWLVRHKGMGNSMVYFDYGTMLLECRLNYLKERNTDFGMVTKEFLLNARLIVDSGYGIVTVMPEEKYPRDYFMNSTSAYLNHEERQDIKIWEREGHRYETIVRDIYWGNVITRSHWGNDKAKEAYFLKALGHECHGNIEWINEDTLFFHAPFDICPQGDPKMIDFKSRLYKLFDECDIEVIRAHMDRYPEPPLSPDFVPIKTDATKPKKLKSKKTLIIRYQLDESPENTKEHQYILKILSQSGPVPLALKKEKGPDGVWINIRVEGVKVPEIRETVVYCIRNMDMNIEINPPIDSQDIGNSEN